MTGFPGKIEAELGKRDVFSGISLEDEKMLWCFTEKNSKDEMDAVAQVLTQIVKTGD